MKKLICALIACSNLIWCIGSMSNTVQAVEIAQGTCGESCTWSLDDDGVLTISGTGGMDDFHPYSTPKIPWAEWNEQIHSVIIEEGITEIGECAFYNMEQLADVALPETLKKIGNFAFQNTGITEIQLTKNVVSIGGNSFASCDDLTNVALNENLKEIGKEAFYYSDNLKTLYIPPSVTTIVDWAYGFRMTSDGDWLGIPDETKTIQGYQGSYAETYAYENELNFESVEPVIKGDVNGDGVVDVFDVALLKRQLLNQNTKSKISIHMTSADVDGDGKLSAKDLRQINDYVMGKSTRFSADQAMLLDHTVVHREWTHISKEYNDGYIRVTSSPSELWDVMQSVCPYLTDEDDSIVEETKALYENQNIIVLFSSAGASTRKIEIDSVSVEHGVLTAATTTRDFPYGSPDMSSECILIAVDKELTGGVQDVILTDHFETLDSIW